MARKKKIAPRKKYAEINKIKDALSFDDFVSEGIASGADLTKGMPDRFSFHGKIVDREDQDTYLLPVGTDGIKLRFIRGEMLLIDANGLFAVCDMTCFKGNYFQVKGFPSVL